MSRHISNYSMIADKMRAHDLPEIIINNFKYYYELVSNGNKGLISEQEIEPIDQVEEIEGMEAYADAGRSVLHKTAVIKLNGGLGTSMGLDKAKSLLIARNHLTFLDISIRQILSLRSKYNTYIPLIFMNSFNTDTDTKAILKTYSEFEGVIPATMTQYKVPKILQDSLMPADWPENPDLEWCPPGHGEIYIALATSGILDTLIANGYDYAFISNIDNLGATLDLGILGYIAENKVPFMMEVADRTPADKKGGHLARQKDGNLVLREVAQCPDEDLQSFQNIKKHKYFNSNNLWIDLRVLKEYLIAHNNVLQLPLIRNAKTVDPKKKTSPKVYQLETAMGSAIAVFPGAQAVRVTKKRFLPIKNCSDLLALRSDIYHINEEYEVFTDPKRILGSIKISLDDEYYKMISDFEDRIHYIPSLIECEKLEIEGDVVFNRGVKIKGTVTIANKEECQCNLPKNKVFDNNTYYCKCDAVEVAK